MACHGTESWSLRWRCCCGCRSWQLGGIYINSAENFCIDPQEYSQGSDDTKCRRKTFTSGLFAWYLSRCMLAVLWSGMICRHLTFLPNLSKHKYCRSQILLDGLSFNNLKWKQYKSLAPCTKDGRQWKKSNSCFRIVPPHHRHYPKWHVQIFDKIIRKSVETMLNL